jgi:RNA polymerase sigma-70 factor (ECF subfamily)
VHRLALADLRGTMVMTAVLPRGGGAVERGRDGLPPFGDIRPMTGESRAPAAEPSAELAGEQALEQALAERPGETAPPNWTPPSWDEVVRTHSARVYRLAYRLTGNQHDAEDLTQEVFVRVFRSLSSYRPGTFEGWLHRITTNLFLDGVRRKARIRFEGLAEDAAERLPGREPSPAQAYHDAHLDADVQAALDSLAPEFRAAVVLCDIEGLSYEEIAASLGVKLGTVRSRIHRGRTQLRAALGHRAPREAAARASSVPPARTDEVEPAPAVPPSGVAGAGERS